MTKEKLKTNGSISEESTAITKPDYENEIVSVIRGNLSPLVMQERLEDYHGNDIAQVLERLSPQERKKLCRICTVDMLAEIFEHLDEEPAGVYLSEMPVKKAADVISELETDTAVAVLHEIATEKRELIIEALLEGNPLFHIGISIPRCRPAQIPCKIIKLLVPYTGAAPFRFLILFNAEVF